MTRLTQPADWDAKYDNKSSFPPQEPTRGLKEYIKRLLGPRIVELSRDYCEYLLWDVLYKTYLPSRRGARVLEVGSAPGDHLVQLHHVFGYQPFGVEYAPARAELNRECFKHHGIDPGNVIEADFLSTGFQERFRNAFDIVVSRGFIEHFTDVESVIDSHLNVLRSGGRLIISIPNLRGVNYALTRFFNKDLLPLHNLAIMQLETFSKLFERKPLSKLTSQYYGTCNFGLFLAEKTSVRRHLLPVAAKIQRLLNVLLRSFLGATGWETNYLSPYLIFIGVKKP
jgi:SAM-dependent methyltransferase